MGGLRGRASGEERWKKAPGVRRETGGESPNGGGDFPRQPSFAKPTEGKQPGPQERLNGMTGSEVP